MVSSLLPGKVGRPSVLPSCLAAYQHVPPSARTPLPLPSARQYALTRRAPTGDDRPPSDKIVSRRSSFVRTPDPAVTPGHVSSCSDPCTASPRPGGATLVWASSSCCSRSMTRPTSPQLTLAANPASDRG
ncbi:hypothetical protein C8Q76DRAFT_723705 [Earliella scabrosa]|nr:hypothetical protein C8Q76DRAFT_723705 [Earliella scabrosa]